MYQVIPQQNHTPRTERAPRNSPQERDALIESVRRMLANGQGKRDIKTLLMRTKGFTSKTALKYVSAAQQRNRQVLGVSAEDQRASSLNFYSEKVMVLESLMQHSKKRYLQAQARRTELESQIRSATREEARKIRGEMKQNNSERHRALNEFLALMREQAFYRNRFDDIAGVSKPAKVVISSTSATQGDSKPAAAELLTLSGMERRKVEILAVVKAREAVRTQFGSSEN